MLTQLLPGLLAISVPEDAAYIDAHDADSEDGCCVEFLSKGKMRQIYMPFDFDILGLVTLSEVDFDCSGIVEKIEDDNGLYIQGQYFGDYTFKNYQSDEVFIYPELSLCSLITSKGLHFVNPMGEKPKADDYSYEDYYITDKFDKDLTAWQDGEINLVKKLVIIKEI